MTAPVSGSGRWPPWMTRVPKRSSESSLLIGHPLGADASAKRSFGGRARQGWRARSLHGRTCGGPRKTFLRSRLRYGWLLSQPAAQPIEQIDARDEPLKLVVVHDDGLHAALEDLHELRHRGIHRHGHQVT